jgi:hypothetical protein
MRYDWFRKRVMIGLACSRDDVVVFFYLGGSEVTVHD